MSSGTGRAMDSAKVRGWAMVKGSGSDMGSGWGMVTAKVKVMVMGSGSGWGMVTGKAKVMVMGSGSVVERRPTHRGSARRRLRQQAVPTHRSPRRFEARRNA